MGMLLLRVWWDGLAACGLSHQPGCGHTPRVMETDWSEAVDSQQLSAAYQFAHALGYVLLSLCQLPSSSTDLSVSCRLMSCSGLQRGL